MKKIADKQCPICAEIFSPSKNDRPNSWIKRIFCSSKCCNSRPNKGTFKVGHNGHPNSHSFPKGHTPWNIGKKHLQDEKHPNWKGDEVGYHALHNWVKRKMGTPTTCQNCKGKFSGRQIHWANKTGEYKRDITDWLRLCAKCHRQYDLINNLLNKYGKEK